MTLSEIIRELLSGLPSGSLYNLPGSAVPLFLAFRDGPFIMVESGDELARKAWRDVSFYRRLAAPGTPPAVLFPAPDGPVYAGERAKAVYEFSKRKASIITSVDALEGAVWPPEELRRLVLHLKVGAELERESVRDRLEGLGYVGAPLVTEQGQYSMRGWILDVFPSMGEQPMRVEFFGDEIDSIRAFDIETQRSVSVVKGISLMPAVEPPASPENMTLAGLVSGLDWLYAEESGDEIRTTLAEIPENAASLSRYAIKPLRGEGADAGFLPMGGLGILPEERKSLYELSHAVKTVSSDEMIVVVASSKGQAERLRDIFRDGDVVSPIMDIGALSGYDGSVSIVVGELSSGLHLPGLLILTEQEIFGGRPAYRAIKKSKVSKLLASLDDLMPGDYVVHKDHGIGRFIGLEKQSIEGSEYELMIVEYGEGGRIYLPLHSIERVKKFHSEEGVVPKVDRLGTRSWQKTKEKIKQKIKEMAEKLLKLYAEREIAEGFSFSPDTELHREFDSFFLYEETPDQMRAIEEIKRDMESLKPMDRLLCGDVGYGKTEVAMRAAFKAVYDSKQVAVLVPTTLLCEQHQRIFKKRFSGFPINIDYLSRFKSKKEQTKALKALAEGSLDIIIATHSLLRGGVSFRDLGLLVIDEEHRFGVKQKERLKEFKKGVDVLTLTATPIPRTLQMALSGIRQMSLIETPPEERLAVKSIVSVFDEGLIKEAIEKEIERGGQVFFVHNRILDIDKTADFLKRTVPKAKIAVAHGRTPERELERTMLSFLNGEIDVLLSTAIVGSGLDIPTSNTIIVDMAHRMGLADLYQLKGRVGRSNVKAFAYFLMPGDEIITDEARKRLQAIQELSYMGAGFRLAMKDLEIRGAGNLLGAEQSGYMHAIGFDLYVEMLEQAVAEIKGIAVKEEALPTVSLKVKAFIPEDYIEDAILRLSIYRAIASAKTEKDIEGMTADMTDRFGPPPEAFGNLLRIMSVRLMAEKLGIADIRQSDGRVRVAFSSGAEVSADSILKSLSLKNFKKVRFHPDGFEFQIKGDAVEEINSALKALINI